MSTIKDKINFNFNGKDSKDFGLMAVSLSTGMYEEQLAPTRNIDETKSSKRDTSIFHGIEEEDREFDLEIAFEDSFDETKINDVVAWLFTDYYKPLYFEGQENKISFSMISGSSSIIHNGMGRGYFTVSVKTNSPYKYSQMIEASNTEPLVIDLKNDGHKDVYPEISIKKLGVGDIKINANGKNVLIVNLENQEELYIDTLREKIVTDVIGTYRYDNIKAGELEDLIVKVGGTKYTIEGDAEIKCRYREKFLF